MTEEIHLCFHDPIEDEMEIKAKAQIMDLMNKLTAEGFPFHSVGRAMAGSLVTLCWDEYEKLGEHAVRGKRFLREVENGFREEYDTLNNIELRAHARLRNRLAGGNGTPYQ